ncbi:MAG: hypothetical protein WCG27_04930 [Pseudomonadota bacterium]
MKKLTVFLFLILWASGAWAAQKYLYLIFNSEDEHSRNQILVKNLMVGDLYSSILNGKKNLTCILNQDKRYWLMQISYIDPDKITPVQLSTFDVNSEFSVSDTSEADAIINFIDHQSLFLYLGWKKTTSWAVTSATQYRKFLSRMHTSTGGPVEDELPKMEDVGTIAITETRAEPKKEDFPAPGKVKCFYYQAPIYN